jgi:prepilin peptidase CpaA
MPLATQIVLLLVVGTAAWSDFRTRQIPNEITVPGAVLGFALYVWHSGVQGAWTSLEGALLGLGIFIVFFLVGGMGAGDVKLFAAVGSLVGPQALLLVFVFTGVLGGIVAGAVAIWRGHLRANLPYGAVIAGGTFIFWVAKICSVIEY